MAALDLDPTFARALRLMHSKSKDSEEQLRNMLDEAIKQRHGSSKTLSHIFSKKESLNKRESTKSSSSSSSGRKDEYRKEGEKKNYDKTSMEETLECSRENSSSKRPKSSDSSKSGHSKPSSPSSSNAVTLSNIHETEPVKEESLQQDDGDDGLSLEILEEDLTCVVCRGMDVVARNQLVECIECHSLYHQECHQPPVAEADMNDPRSAWYCSDCTKQNAGKQGSSSNMTYTSTGKPSFATITTKSSTSPSFTSTKSFGGPASSVSKQKSHILKDKKDP